MSALDQVVRARAFGVKLENREGKLGCIATRSPISPELKAELQQHKAEILALLGKPWPYLSIDDVVWSEDDHRFVGRTSPRLTKKYRRDLEAAARRSPAEHGPARPDAPQRPQGTSSRVSGVCASQSCDTREHGLGRPGAPERQAGGSPFPRCAAGAAGPPPEEDGERPMIATGSRGRGDDRELLGVPRRGRHDADAVRSRCV